MPYREQFMATPTDYMNILGDLILASNASYVLLCQGFVFNSFMGNNSLQAKNLSAKSW